MSFRKDKLFSLDKFDQKQYPAGIDISDYSAKDLAELWREMLESGMHGLCYSAYEEGQKPGDILTEDQIRRRIQIIAPYTKWVRTFSCIEGNELIAKVAKDMGMKTMVGAWLGTDKELIEEEIEGLIKLAKDGLVDIAAVGNEVLYRNDMSKEELLGYINRVKAAIPNVQVGYVDAYYEFSLHPDIVDACDVVLANCYPYWESCHIDYAHMHMQQMYHQAKAAAKGKKVIITETGWPSQGTPLHAAEPSRDNAIRYFLNTQKWSKDAGIEVFYFSSFDEAWKVGAEGDVGAYWGLWDKAGKLKF